MSPYADWRARLAELALPVAVAHEVAVLVLRRRVWGAAGRYIQQADR